MDNQNVANGKLLGKVVKRRSFLAGLLALSTVPVAAKVLPDMSGEEALSPKLSRFMGNGVYLVQQDSGEVTVRNAQ
ncbi:MAG: hypothetical protein OIF56_13725 [Cohaesibacter sp.]|nr:hypothetical protein [Cohaesibacter sp.]